MTEYPRLVLMNPRERMWDGVFELVTPPQHKSLVEQLQSKVELPIGWKVAAQNNLVVEQVGDEITLSEPVKEYFRGMGKSIHDSVSHPPLVEYASTGTDDKTAIFLNAALYLPDAVVTGTPPMTLGGNIKELTEVEIQELFDSLTDDQIFEESMRPMTLKDILEGKVALDPPAHPSEDAGARRLRIYWTRGPGAAKIRWGVPHDFYRCRDHLTKYVGARASGLCANYHKVAIGSWPGREGGKDLFTVNDTTNALLIKLMNDDTILATDADDYEGETR